LFSQADWMSRRGGGGLGIGLSLVRSLVELHGGSVEAYSAGPDAGARFTVRLPFTPEIRSPAALETGVTAN
jgi:signal transduction histidine kinase